MAPRLADLECNTVAGMHACQPGSVPSTTSWRVGTELSRRNGQRADPARPPQGLAGLVLVAPAILAGRSPAAPREAAAPGSPRGDPAADDADAAPGPGSPRGPPAGRRPPWRRVARVAAAAATEAAAAAARAVLWLLTPVLILALRCAVRSRAFWERGLASAWCAWPSLGP